MTPGPWMTPARWKTRGPRKTPDLWKERSMKPVPDSDTKPYWDGIADGELRLQR